MTAHSRVKLIVILCVYNQIFGRHFLYRSLDVELVSTFLGSGDEKEVGEEKDVSHHFGRGVTEFEVALQHEYSWQVHLHVGHRGEEVEMGVRLHQL